MLLSASLWNRVQDSVSFGELDKPVPECMVLDAHPIGSIRIAFNFQPFPNNNYVCRKVGHYARNCPVRASQEKDLKGQVGDKHANKEQKQGGKRTEISIQNQVDVEKEISQEDTSQDNFTVVRGRRKGRGRGKSTDGMHQGLKTFFASRGRRGEKCSRKAGISPGGQHCEKGMKTLQVWREQERQVDCTQSPKGKAMAKAGGMLME
eukprot:c13876_g1_i1 orf=2120-2737(-)